MNMLQKRSIKELQDIYKLVDRICAKHKECESKHKIPYIIIGLAPAAMQGAPIVTI